MLSGLTTTATTAVARCPHCRYPYTIGAEHLGVVAQCEKCRSAFTMAADEAVGRIGPRPRIPGERALPSRVRSVSDYAPSAGHLILDSSDLVGLAPPDDAQLASDRWLALQAVSASASTTPAGSLAPVKPPASRDTDRRGIGKYFIWMVVAAVGAVGVLCLCLAALKNTKLSSGDDAPAAFVPSGPPPALTFHLDGAGRRVADVVVRGRRSAGTEVRLVLPPGEHAAGSVPCVFVCPAGSNLLVGVPFGDGEREDFYPLLDRGLAVCFYSLDGTVPDLQAASERQILSAIEPYMKSDGGIANLSDAIDTVLAGCPPIDPARLGTAGHSSAGTIAIMAAAREPRIRAVAAMAPAIDVPRRLAEVASADKRLAGYIRRVSPSKIDKLPCPVWIYHANDDVNVPVRDAWEFKLKHDAQVSVRAVPTGGHVGAYRQGLPEAADFLAATLKAHRPPRQP